jgi:hypothetical protein
MPPSGAQTRPVPAKPLAPLGDGGTRLLETVGVTLLGASDRMSRSSHLLARPGDPRWVGAMQTLGEGWLDAEGDAPAMHECARSPKPVAPLGDGGTRLLETVGVTLLRASDRMSRSSHLLARPDDPRWVGATQTLGEVGSTQKEMPPSCMNALARPSPSLRSRTRDELVEAAGVSG